MESIAVKGLTQFPNGPNYSDEFVCDEGISEVHLHIANCTSAEPDIWPDPTSYIEFGLMISDDGGRSWRDSGGGGAGAYGGRHLRRTGEEAEFATLRYRVPISSRYLMKVWLDVRGGPVMTKIQVDLL